MNARRAAKQGGVIIIMTTISNVPTKVLSGKHCEAANSNKRTDARMAGAMLDARHKNCSVGDGNAENQAMAWRAPKMARGSI